MAKVSKKKKSAPTLKNKSNKKISKKSNTKTIKNTKSIKTKKEKPEVITINKVKSEHHLLEVKDLHTSFNIPAGEVRSVNGVSFTVDEGEVVGIVGESGSGKSVTAYSVMQILDNPGKVVGGSILFKGQELLNIPSKQLQKFRGEKVSIIFQDAMSSLNPVWSIGNQLEEVIKVHPNSNMYSFIRNVKETAEKKYKDAKNDPKSDLLLNELYTASLDNQKKIEKLEKSNNADSSKISYLKELDGYYKAAYNLRVNELYKRYQEANKKYKEFPHNRAIEMLKLVGINEPEKRLKQYPFEFSGGMLQRIMIAMALANEPDLIIADEPTTALDVTIQAQILELLVSIQKKMGMGVIIITHDLGVVAQVCDKVNVMYAGRIVESGTVQDIFYNPKHEYTKGLMNSIPKTDAKSDRLIPIQGNPVDVFCLPEGCSFVPRCDKCMKVCLKKYPNYFNVNSHHKTACFAFVKELLDNKVITEKQFDKYLDSCSEGNKAFTPINLRNVYDAKLKYLNLKNQGKTKLSNPDLKVEEKEVIKFRISDSRNEYYRIRKDYKNAKHTFKTSLKESASINKNDLRKKVRANIKDIKNQAVDLTKNQFEDFINNLVICTTQPNYDLNNNVINELKKKLHDLKNQAKNKNLDRKDLINIRVQIVSTKRDIIKGKNDLKWLKYVTKKMASTKKKLNRIYEKKHNQISKDIKEKKPASSTSKRGDKNGK